MQTNKRMVAHQYQGTTRQIVDWSPVHVRAWLNDERAGGRARADGDWSPQGMESLESPAVKLGSFKYAQNGPVFQNFRIAVSTPPPPPPPPNMADKEKKGQISKSFFFFLFWDVFVFPNSRQALKTFFCQHELTCITFHRLKHNKGILGGGAGKLFWDVFLIQIFFLKKYEK